MKSVLLCCAVGALLALPATPQSLELGISGGYGTPSDNTLSVAEDLDAAVRGEVSISNGVRIGGRMAFNSWRFIGHEVSYAYQHAGLDFLSDSSDGSSAADYGAVKVHHMYYNLVAHALPEGSPIRPFVTGGGGFSSFFLPRRLVILRLWQHEVRIQLRGRSQIQLLSVRGPSRRSQPRHRQAVRPTPAQRHGHAEQSRVLSHLFGAARVAIRLLPRQSGAWAQLCPAENPHLPAGASCIVARRLGL